MKNLRLSELFSQDELQGIMTAAQAEYNVKYSHDKEGKDIYLFLLSVDYAHAAYILHQSEEYMKLYNDFKKICELKGDTTFLRIWMGMCLNTALHNPEYEVKDILSECSVNLYYLTEKHFGDIIKN